MLSDPIPEEELRKAKNYLKGRFVLGIEDPRGLIMFGVRTEAVEDGLRDPAKVLEAIEAVTMDDVRRIASEILVAENLNLAVLGPFEDADHFKALLQPEPVAV